MPKIVDHEERRRELILATWRVIARSGLSGATMKQISEEAGYSSGTIVHYFADKQEILARSLEAAHEEVRRIYAEIADGQDLTGLSALRTYMQVCLPLDEHRRNLAAVELAFWGEAMAVPELISLNSQESSAFHNRITTYLSEAVKSGEMRDDLDIDRAALKLRLLMDGLSIQSVVNPNSPSPEEQLDLLEEVLQTFTRASA